MFLAHREGVLGSAQRVDPDAEATRIGRWKVDMVLPALALVIENDGSYWHANKLEVDARKTRDLIAAGFRVARIRENDLAHLELSNSRLLQVTYRSSFGDPSVTVSDVVAWARANEMTRSRSTGG